MTEPMMMARYWRPRDWESRLNFSPTAWGHHDDDGEVLEAEGLGVEVEFLADGLGHHDDDGDVGVAEDEGVCDCWDENGGDGCEVEEGDEGHEGEWRGVDAADLEVVEK
jgi:hypothetical protein